MPEEEPESVNGKQPRSDIQRIRRRIPLRASPMVARIVSGRDTQEVVQIVIARVTRRYAEIVTEMIAQLNTQLIISLVPETVPEMIPEVDSSVVVPRLGLRDERMMLRDLHGRRQKGVERAGRRKHYRSRSRAA
jgi:hypothetical protein